MSDFFSSPSLYAFIGALIAAIAAFVSAHKQSVFENEIKTHQATIERQADEIQKLNKEIQNTITGGDTICYISPIFLQSNSVIGFILSSKGEYPLHDISIRAVDIPKFKSIKTLNIDTMTDGDAFHFSSINLGKGQNLILVNKIPLTVPAKGSYNFFITHRGDSYTQQLDFYIKDDKLYQTTTLVSESDRDTVLYEETTDAYDPSYSIR
ncbi:MULTISPECIES: hypothetical protein [unclassified Pseudodesulfovibrio]|uniref:hypothetical protein n=1 Tax=unclassified Pseudodesulfovibrio TaxID=2661612 RepID=UPI000FEBCD55|nr:MULTISPECIES: hypothetical protein [unclassified Pseudodesulfovibrio]MCJ2166261.1 hypothetical protein [Pseudodesulfovibrio sp. S3-i]RWU02292.1 hypothetical protein DWB63_16935 [Pseudodesulfovibrio sp. S3]